MILIDALYINNGGGKILLDYLIYNLENTNKNFFYLLDIRVKNNISCELSNRNNIVFLKASLFNRYKFYYHNKDKFSTVLCFGNLPPMIKLNSLVFTYFHQRMYLEIPKNFSKVDKLKFLLKIKVLNSLKTNTNYWIVQSQFIQNKLVDKYSLNKNDVKIIPFYPPLNKHENIQRINQSYLYVSNPTPHKNHILLINAFCEFFDKFKRGKLTVTVDDSNINVLNLIKEKQKGGYPINNIGFVERGKLEKEYYQSEFLIFPSLAESFGLGIVEAIDCGCKVLGADLPYMHEACIPSLVFNPMDKESIIQCLSLSLKTELPKSISKINNQINDILHLLQ